MNPWNCGMRNANCGIRSPHSFGFRSRISPNPQFLPCYEPEILHRLRPRRGEWPGDARSPRRRPVDAGRNTPVSQCCGAGPGFPPVGRAAHLRGTQNRPPAGCRTPRVSGQSERGLLGGGLRAAQRRAPGAESAISLPRRAHRKHLRAGTQGCRRRTDFCRDGYSVHAHQHNLPPCFGRRKPRAA